MDESEAVAQDEELLLLQEEEDEVANNTGCSTAGNSDGYQLHRAVWEGDMATLHALLAAKPSKEQLKQLDPHGNTALHVAAMRGHVEVVEALLAAGMPAAARNTGRWQALHEAVQFQHKCLAHLLVKAHREQLRIQVKDKRAALMEQLKQLPDFTMQLKWELCSSVPGVGLLLRRFAPHDTYTIWKKGARLRVDGTLMGVSEEGMGAGGVIPEWERGHFSLLYTCVNNSTQAYFVNHNKKEWMDIKALHKSLAPEQQSAVQSEVESMLVSVAANDGVLETQCVKSRDFRFDPVKGWVTRHLTEQVDGWKAKVYDASLMLVKVKRFKVPSALPAKATWDEYLTATPPQDLVLEVPTHPVTSMVLCQGKQEAKEAAYNLKETAKKEAKKNMAASGRQLATPPITRTSPKLVMAVKPTKTVVEPTDDAAVGDCEGQGGEGACPAGEKGEGKGCVCDDTDAAEGVPGRISVEHEGEMVKQENGDVGRTQVKLNGVSLRECGDGEGGEDDVGVVGQGKDLGGVGGGKRISLEQDGRHTMSDSKSLVNDVEDLSGLPGTMGESEMGPDVTLPALKPVKRMTGRCWMAEDFPLSLTQLLPLLEAIGAANKHISKVAQFMSKYGDRKEFPVKVQIPLIFTLSISLAFKKFKLLPSPTPTSTTASTTTTKKSSRFWFSSSSSNSTSTSATTSTSGTSSKVAGQLPTDHFEIPNGYTQVEGDASTLSPPRF